MPGSRRFSYFRFVGDVLEQERQRARQNNGRGSVSAGAAAGGAARPSPTPSPSPSPGLSQPLARRPPQGSARPAPCCRIFLGNPGAGKSALINCLTGSPVFEAGPSNGGPKTKQLGMQTSPSRNVTYADTPGLANTKIHPESASVIDQVLRLDSLYQLFFVVRASNARISVDDIFTINWVMQAIQLSDVPFGIIINGIESQHYRELQQHGEAYARLVASLSAGAHSTPHLYLLPKIEQLDEEENAIAELPSDFRHFVEEVVPSSFIPKEAVREISTDQEAYKSAVQSLSVRQEQLLANAHTIFTLMTRAPQAPRGSTTEVACVVCLDATRNAACLPCGHVAMCIECAQLLARSTGKCPVCRTTAAQVMRVYI